MHQESDIDSSSRGSLDTSAELSGAQSHHHQGGKARKIWRQAISFVILVLLNILYIYVGSWAFIFLEKSNRESAEEQDERALQHATNQIIDIRGRGGTETERRAAISQEIIILEKKLALIFRKSTDGKIQDPWSIWGSYIYCYQILSTIGWGNIVPKNNGGKALTIVYSIFGLPLFFAVTNALGDVINSIVLKLYKIIRWIVKKLFICFCGKGKKRVTSIASSDISDVSSESTPRGRDVTRNKADSEDSDPREQRNRSAQWEGYACSAGDEEALARVFSQHDPRSVLDVMEGWGFTRDELLAGLPDPADHHHRQQQQQQQQQQQNKKIPKKQRHKNINRAGQKSRSHMTKTRSGRQPNKPQFQPSDFLDANKQFEPSDFSDEDTWRSERSSRRYQTRSPDYTYSSGIIPLINGSRTGNDKYRGRDICRNAHLPMIELIQSSTSLTDDESVNIDSDPTERDFDFSSVEADFIPRQNDADLSLNNGRGTTEYVPVSASILRIIREQNYKSQTSRKIEAQKASNVRFCNAGKPIQKCNNNNAKKSKGDRVSKHSEQLTMKDCFEDGESDERCSEFEAGSHVGFGGLRSTQEAHSAVHQHLAAINRQVAVRQTKPHHYYIDEMNPSPSYFVEEFDIDGERYDEASYNGCYGDDYNSNRRAGDRDENINADNRSSISSGSSDDDEFEEWETLPMVAHFLLMLLYIFFGAGVLTLFAEDKATWTFGNAIYFIYISLSTTGYGDFVPENHIRIFFLIYAFFGLAMFQVLINSLISIIAAALEGLNRSAYRAAGVAAANE